MAAYLLYTSYKWKLGGLREGQPFIMALVVLSAVVWLVGVVIELSVAKTMTVQMHYEQMAHTLLTISLH